MTWLTIVLFLLGCAVLAFVVWAVVRGGTLMPGPALPASMPRRKRGPLTEAFCPVCGQAGVYMTKRGLPNRRFHSCAASVNVPSVLVPFVQIDEPQPAQTVTTGPPQVAS
jgi:hypothetical protein